MPKAGEVTYLQKLGPAGAAHARDKPFSDPACGELLLTLAAIRQLLPPPPARLLDLGCGTGWTSCFLARMGYEVDGKDIAPDMIANARVNQARYQASTASFCVADFESLACREEFDGAVFFDSLHHAEDERRALDGVYRALKPGGVCVLREPGAGHAAGTAAREAVRLYGVTEKELPAETICALGRAVGFRSAVVRPMPLAIIELHWGRPRPARGRGRPSLWTRSYERLTAAPFRRRLRRWREVEEMASYLSHLVVLTK